MTWLAEWLKEIIFVVLLATFIDLLLPNRSMERYVKLVVSLLILLTLISPVMRLFAPDAERRLEMAFMDDSGNEEMPTAGTEEILRQGEQMRMQRQQEAMQWAGEEAAARMKEQIERETGQPVQRVAVRLESDKNDAEPTISAIEVYIAEVEQEQEASPIENQASSSRNDSAQIIIAPVEPVRIEVKPQKKEPGDEDSIPVIADSSGSDIASNTGTKNNEKDTLISGSTGEGIHTGNKNRQEPGLYGESVSQETGSSGLSRQIAGLLSRDWGIPKELVHIILPENAK
ncbi:stage III sporulation protein AF [Paenibacillus humicus]|uniref:stage III sporulation protein AF n=1 Tax=Paenibacillus humicus TaxID=412861 RepID=UPI003D2DAC43